MTYSEQLQSPLWQRKRLEILSRDNFTCVSCGDSQSQLHVHHGYYEKGLMAWEYDDKFLHTLCKNCHYTTTLLMDIIYRVIGETNPIFLWDLEWMFTWIKIGNVEQLRKWIIDTENKNTI